MKKVIITRGLPASGKSTWAKQQVREHPGRYSRVNRDDLRAMLHCKRFTRQNEKLVCEARDALILQSLKAGRHVIVDETSLNPDVIDDIRKVVGKEAEVEIKEFKKDVDDCIRDDAARDNPVGKNVILGMYQRWIAKTVPKFQQDETLPKAFLCDLDGTIADLNGRNPYDASTCENDLPRMSVVELVKRFGESHQIIFMSGRDDKHFNPTYRWLRKLFPYQNFWLLMRKTGDMRDDTIVKEELFMQNVAPKFYVDFAVDDRPKVVRTWRKLGIFVFDVGEGIEF